MIHTDGICDVYNVTEVHMDSSGISDTQNYSVIFQDTRFDDHEYMFTNDLGIVDDLTMDKYLSKVTRPVLESLAYDLSDAESPQIPVPPSPIPILDMGYISPDPDDIRGCTRQLELYYRVLPAFLGVFALFLPIDGVFAISNRSNCSVRRRCLGMTTRVTLKYL